MKTALCRKWARAVRSLRTRQGSVSFIFSLTASLLPSLSLSIPPSLPFFLPPSLPPSSVSLELPILSATAPNEIGAGAAMGRDERGLAAMELLRVFAESHRRPESACGGAGREPAAQRRLHHLLCPQSGATMPAQTGGGVERERIARSILRG